jgi:4-hydroxy-tetrahydrodipicolinate synthase
LIHEVVLQTLPGTRCLAVAVATPLTHDFRPDVTRWLSHIRAILAAGCDGVTIFGTTGEGAEFPVEDRINALNALIAAGIPAGRVVVSVGTAAIADVVRLASHATKQGVHGVLLMPPPFYRSGITEEATFRYFATIIDRIAMPDLRLYLYHFPDICGVPITPQVMRRLDERYPGIIAGIKDSSGDLDFTLDIVRRFSHLSIFTGSEIHLPELIELGARGTICGLGNVMPRLMRALIDAPTAFDRRALVSAVQNGDAILSRRPFIPSIKAVVSGFLEDVQWQRVIPPMPELPLLERDRIVADFVAWDAALPPHMRSNPASNARTVNVVDLRRA